MLRLQDSWAWDFWLAQDSGEHHLFFLQAPRSLGDPHRRHRAARIGHATSTDLSHWTPQAQALGPGEVGDFDQDATWTGCVVRGEDGLWRMFYTGSRFLHPEPEHTNIESIGVAVSADLQTWTKRPGPVVSADDRWYETYQGDPNGWKEEAWRDPWVFRDPHRPLWHMLVTARANHGAIDDRGVIGHATSTDLETWQVQPPLSAPGSGFAHLEVPQVVQVHGQWLLVFSCPSSALSAEHAARRQEPGTWVLAIEDPTGPFDVARAQPLTTSAAYSGRLVEHDAGRWSLLTFDNPADAPFDGVINDPVEVKLTSENHLVVVPVPLTPASPAPSQAPQPPPPAHTQVPGGAPPPG